MSLIVHNENDIEQHLATVKASAKRAANELVALANSPSQLFWRMKFEQFGRHPIEDRSLNLVEQINQSWTYVSALEASRKLLKCHQGQVFQLAPGAHAALPFDIVNLNGNICAETFAAVHPDNNNKLERDIAKLELHAQRHSEASCYVFFISPQFHTTARLPNRERAGIQVWSISCAQWVNELP
jgi:hypothetical protein